MTLQFDAATRNARGNAIESTVGTSAILRIYSAGSPAMPAQVADPIVPGSTLLAEFSLASDWIAAFSSGQASFNNLPLSTTCLADGVAYYFRIYSSDGTTCRVQGTCTQVDEGGDLIMSNTGMGAGETVQITALTITEGGE